MEIVRQGTGRWNPEIPPLAKIVAGLALAGTNLRLAENPLTEPSHARALVRFLFENETLAETILFRARIPFVGVFVLLLLAVRAEARRRFGALPGLCALAFCALEPNLLAHAGVVNTDLLVTLFIVLSLGPLAQLADPAARRAPLVLGALWGLAFLTKFHAPLLVLMTIPLAAGAGWRGSGRRILSRAALAAGVAGAVTLAGYALAARSQTPLDRAALARDRLLVRGRSETALGVALRLSSAFPPAGNLAVGAGTVLLQNRAGGGVNYLAGRTDRKGSPLFFPLALALKISLGLALGFAVGASGTAGRRTALAVAAALVLFFAATASSAYNIGVRHVLVAFPFLALAAAAGAAQGTRRAALAALAIAIQGVEVAAVHPHELSFFNAAAGGMTGGHRWLVDSNLDWGQDLGRLASRAPSLSAGPLPAVVFGGDYPARYPSLRGLAPGDEDSVGALLAIGETPFAIGPEFFRAKGASRDAARLDALREALRARGERIGEIGGSIGLWRIRAAAPLPSGTEKDVQRPPE